MKPLKTRFAPSPTGYLHVGGARTALFSYVMARKTGGTFVFRIEDTDRGRHDEDAVAKIIDDLRWLGIHWDEGLDAAGDAGPYRQSERLDIYKTYVQRLLDEGKAYYAFETAEELEAMRTAAQEKKENFRYARPAPLPSTAQVQEARDRGKPVVVRFMCPNEDVTILDDVFGEVIMPADQVDDFIIQKADGYPTYHLANVVDDALMGINYIMRGQEFLGQSWRHKVLRGAFGFEEPGYCHLPLIMDMQGRKLSKRDGDVEVFAFRKAGFLPETIINFLALLGWNPGSDIEKFSLDELIELFGVDRIGKTNPKFDRDKLLAFNTGQAASINENRLLEAFKDYLAVNDTPIPSDDAALLAQILQANRGFRTFEDIINKCGILFGENGAIEYDEKAVHKWLNKAQGEGWTILADIRQKLAGCNWTHEDLEKFIEDYCRDNEVGMGKVAQPIRVALTGSSVSPQLSDTLIFTGKQRTLDRIDLCLKKRGELEK